MATVASSASPLRVVSLVTNLYIGGDANRLLHFASAVDRRRVEHRLLLVVSPDAEQDRRFGPMRERFAEHGVPIDSLDEPSRAARRAGQSRLGAVWSDVAALRRIVTRLEAYCRANRVDVLDARMDYAILFAAFAGRRAGVPAIVGTEYGPEFWQTPARYPLGQLAFRRLDALILDSAHKKQVYRRWLLGSRPRLVVVRNGIHAPRPRRSRDEMRAVLGLPPGDGVRVVAQVSRIVPYKGHRVLLDAAARVLAEEPRVAFLLCGYPHPASYLADLQALARSLGIGDRVRFVSYPGPIADVWGVVDVHVHASEFDSAPIAIHESMALGLPAVVTDAGGIPELVAHERTGLVVPAGDSLALARALLRVLREPATGRTLGAAARARYLACHRPEHMAAALTDLFAGLVARRPRLARAEVAHVGA